MTLDPEPTTPQRPGARQLRGESERSYAQAGQRPEEVPPEEEETEEGLERDDLTVAPEDLAARFLSDAIEADRTASEERGHDSAAPLPVADEEQDLRDLSREELPPEATGESR